MLANLVERLRGKRLGGDSIPTLFPEFPRDRVAPQDVLRALRATSPDVDLLYMGWGKWLLVRHRPNTANIARGARAIHRAKRMLREWETNQLWRANPGAFKRLYQRYLFWLAVCQGAKVIAEYSREEMHDHGFRGVIDDHRRMEWMLRNTSEQAFWDGIDAPQREKAEAAEAEIRDEYRAKEVVDYLNKRTFSEHNPDVDAESRRSSARTIQARIP
jgi:hypothetical protein